MTTKRVGAMYEIKQVLQKYHMEKKIVLTYFVGFGFIAAVEYLLFPLLYKIYWDSHLNSALLSFYGVVLGLSFVSYSLLFSVFRPMSDSVRFNKNLFYAVARLANLPIITGLLSFFCILSFFLHYDLLGEIVVFFQLLLLFPFFTTLALLINNMRNLIYQESGLWDLLSYATDTDIYEKIKQEFSKNTSSEGPKSPPDQNVKDK